MRDHLLTLNAGSSSIKFALFDRSLTDKPPVLQGQVDGIGLQDGAAATHADALQRIMDQVRERELPIRAIGHRIVHGGSQFVAPVRIDDATVTQMEALVPLAPLHQPHNLAGVRAARHAFAGVAQVACFDTAFHAQQPQINRRFALPQRLFDRCAPCSAAGPWPRP